MERKNPRRQGKTAYEKNFYEKTEVFFKTLDTEEIKAYIRTGEPMDKAGAYGIQEYGAAFVKGICGDYFNVVGLPICRLCDVLKKEFDLCAIWTLHNSTVIWYNTSSDCTR